MSLTPLDDRVLVTLTDVAVATHTKGGLIVPDNAKVYKHRQMRKGRVVAVGGRIDAKLYGVSVGDEVCFLNQSGTMVPEWPGHDHKEGELRMLRDEDLLGVVEPGADVEGRHVEPEDDQNWWDRSFQKPHPAYSDDDAPETD